MVRVAVIDDSSECIALIAELLAARGWELWPSTTTDGILLRLRRERPDIILLDIWLDRQVTGWDLLEELDADPVLHAVPVIICSAARNELQARADWLAERRVGVVDKPFDIDDFYRALEEALGPSQAGSRLTAEQG